MTLLASACQSTTVRGLRVRAEPTTQSAIIKYLGPSGTAVTITCFIQGEAVLGDPVWYRISQPEPGYVSHYYIHTDNDTASTTPPC